MYFKKEWYENYFDTIKDIFIKNIDLILLVLVIIFIIYLFKKYKWFNVIKDDFNYYNNNFNIYNKQLNKKNLQKIEKWEKRKK